jgi:ubiquinone/menaquinone biosynthesis C-methylase UbiE
VEAGLAFDQVAEQYDATWSETAIGRAQREAFWREVDPLFTAGDRILDVGCGTGIDALHFESLGIGVYAIDASAEMVRIARSRGVNAWQQAFPCGPRPSRSARFDGAFANFGALNCIANLLPVSDALARLVRPQGYLAICLMSRCCAWEILHYLGRLKPTKAFRRWHSAGSQASMGVHVYYPSLPQIIHAFRPEFRLIRWRGIGLCVPPSYVSPPGGIVKWLASADRRLAHFPFLRALADHRLLIFQRSGTP